MCKQEWMKGSRFRASVACEGKTLQSSLLLNVLLIKLTLLFLFLKPFYFVFFFGRTCIPTSPNIMSLFWQSRVCGERLEVLKEGPLAGKGGNDYEECCEYVENTHPLGCIGRKHYPHKTIMCVCSLCSFFMT